MRWSLIGFLLMLSLFGCGGKSVEQQARMLGSREFSAESWAAATQEARGEMVASLLAKHEPASLTAKEIIKLLGAPTGYYEYDEYPAYLVGPTSIESDHGKGYLLAFVTDKSTGKVARVIFVPEVGSSSRG